MRRKSKNIEQYQKKNKFETQNIEREGETGKRRSVVKKKKKWSASLNVCTYIDTSSRKRNVNVIVFNKTGLGVNHRSCPKATVSRTSASSLLLRWKRRRSGAEGARRRKIEASANLFDCRPRLTSTVPACGLLTPYGVYLSRVHQAYRPICAREHRAYFSLVTDYITPDILIFRWTVPGTPVCLCTLLYFFFLSVSFLWLGRWKHLEVGD